MVTAVTVTIAYKCDNITQTHVILDYIHYT